LDLAPDFNESCGLLNARRVEFVIVGAHALAFHGAPRYTGDLDILIRPTEANAERLLLAIADFGFPPTPGSRERLTTPRRHIGGASRLKNQCCRAVAAGGLTTLIVMLDGYCFEWWTAFFATTPLASS
jgi:hypothetical protein